MKLDSEGNKPLVSVIITSYNRENYIADAIESVLNSSYSNLELIICDDASTDNTISIARAYESKDSRVKVYANDRNLKQFQNRNKSAEFAKGKYIKYLDSDDIIYYHGLENMVYAMEKYPEAGIGFSFFRYNGEYPLPHLVSSTEAYAEHYFKGGFLYEGPSGAIYRRDYFHEIGKFDLRFGVAADYAFNLKSAMLRPVVIFQRDLCWWRRHESQEVNLHFNSYKYLNFEIGSYYLKHSDCPLGNDEATKALRNIRNITSRRALTYLLKLNFKEFSRLVTNSGISIWAMLISIVPSRPLKK